MNLVDTHTLTAGQVRRLLTDVDGYQLARFGGFTYHVCPSGELDYDADHSITERVDQLRHQRPGLITAICPLQGEYEQLWSLTGAGRAYLAGLRALVHAPDQDALALCGYDSRGEALCRGGRVTCADCRAAMTRSARAWQAVLHTADVLRTRLRGTR